MKPQLKKIIGTAGIVVFSVIYFIIGISIVFTILDSSERKESLFEYLTSMFVVVGILFFPFRFCLKLRQNGINDSMVPLENKNQEVLIFFENKMTLKEYKNLILNLTFKNPFTLYFMFLGFVFFIAALSNPEKYYVTIFGLVFMGIPFLAYLSAGKTFNTNKTLGEQIQYEINQDNIFIKGETFNSLISWNSLYKVKELKNYYLLYTSKQAMLILDKNQLSKNPENEVQFRNLVFSKTSFLKELVNR